MKFLKWNSIISFFKTEWDKKLISLLVATMVWYYVMSISSFELPFSLPIQFINLPENFIIIDSSESIVPLVAKGDKNRLKNIDFSKFIIVNVNLENATPGTKYYDIDVIKLENKLDFSISLLKNKVKLTIDIITNKIVPISISIEGQPSPDYIIEDYILGSKFAKLKGPISVLMQITNLESYPIDISRANTNIISPIKLKLPKFVTIENSDDLYIEVIISKKIP